MLLIGLSATLNDFLAKTGLTPDEVKRMDKGTLIRLVAETYDLYSDPKEAYRVAHEIRSELYPRKVLPVSYSGCSYIGTDYTITNGYMEWNLNISNSSGDAFGSYTARTGSMHTDPHVTILYGAPNAWSSYTTIHSGNSSTDYVGTYGDWVDNPYPGYNLDSLQAYAQQVICQEGGPIKSVTFIYHLTRGGDDLTVKELFWITGSNPDDSRLWHKTIVINNDFMPNDVGVRWQYDTHLRDTDHPAHYECDYYPSFSMNCGPMVTNEIEVNPVPDTFDYLRTSDTDPPSGLYHIFAVYEYGPDSGLVTIPDFVYHAQWPDAYNTPWTWSLSGGDISLGGTDNAFVYFWNPVTLFYGDSVVYYSYIGATRTPAGWDDPTEVSERGEGVRTVVSLSGRRLTLRGDGYASVYTVDGRKVFGGEVRGSESITLDRGVFVVRFGGKTRRVVVR